MSGGKAIQWTIEIAKKFFIDGMSNYYHIWMHRHQGHIMVNYIAYSVCLVSICKETRFSSLGDKSFLGMYMNIVRAMKGYFWGLQSNVYNHGIFHIFYENSWNVPNIFFKHVSSTLCLCNYSIKNTHLFFIMPYTYGTWLSIFQNKDIPWDFSHKQSFMAQLHLWPKCLQKWYWRRFEFFHIG